MSQPQESHPIAWSDEEYRNFGTKPQVSKHTYQQLPLFQTDALIALLDEYPRKHLQAYTIGTDPVRNGDWRQVDIAESTSGADLWCATESGRIWLNLVHIEENRVEYRELIDSFDRNAAQQPETVRDVNGSAS